jgi:hypothetical protein
MSEQAGPVKEPWRDLRLGDRVRIVRLPSGVDEPGYTFLPPTRRLYERLIAGGRTFRIREIDQWGYPRIPIRVRRKSGAIEHHTLALCDDSWVRVQDEGGPGAVPDHVGQ